MNQLYMLELQIDVMALHRFLYYQGLSGRGDEIELGYGVHAWLAAAFGELAPQPWRLLMDSRRPDRILGYSEHDAVVLRQRLVEFADPSVFNVCPEPQMIASRQMPEFPKGRRLGFQVLCCPVGRKAGSGVEKDLFLLKADAVDRDTELSRELVYGEWATSKLREYDIIVDSIELSSFRLVKQIRRTQGVAGNRKECRIVRPQVLLEGELIIGNPDRFAELLVHGLGRHRSFGYGMVLLRPAL